MEPPLNNQNNIATVRCADYSLSSVRDAVFTAVNGHLQARSIIPSGGTVLVKPNLLSPRAPEECVTTHPAVVEAVINLCFKAGAKDVWLGDSCAGEHSDDKLWEKTGMRDVSERTGAKLKSFNNEVKPWTVNYTKVPVPTWLDEIDAWVSVPKLKTHDLTVMTCAVKNSYGLVSGISKSHFHAKHPSPVSMSGFINDIHDTFPPALVLVDAVQAMEGHGPANGETRDIGLIVAGVNSFAVDTVCTQLLNETPLQIPHLRLAAASDKQTIIESAKPIGNGTDLLHQKPLKSSAGRFLQRIPDPLFHVATRVLSRRPAINPDKCRACGLCAEICSKEAISKTTRHNKTIYRIDPKKCITCMCCSETCPYQAIMTSFKEKVRNALSRLFRKNPISPPKS